MVLVRTTRARIIHLRNDYKDLMSRIEKHLHEHFASLQDAEEGPAVASNNREPALHDSIPEQLDRPFAKVNSVVTGSPADSAGLKQGDLIRNFGYVNYSNHDSLKKVAECVQGNEGVSDSNRDHGRAAQANDADKSQQNVLVKVSRSTGSGQLQELRLTLTPRRNWGGRGSLGCHIVPI